jgi:hypothetical protein
VEASHTQNHQVAQLVCTLIPYAADHRIKSHVYLFNLLFVLWSMNQIRRLMGLAQIFFLAPRAQFLSAAALAR